MNIKLNLIGLLSFSFFFFASKPLLAQKSSFEHKRDSIHQLILGDWQLVEFSLDPYVDDTLHEFKPAIYKSNNLKITFKKDEVIFHHNTCGSFDRIYKSRNAIIPIPYFLDSIDLYSIFNSQYDPPPFVIQTFRPKNKRKKYLKEKYEILELSPNTMILKKYLHASYPSNTIYTVAVDETFKRFPIDSTESSFILGRWYFGHLKDSVVRDSLILHKENPFQGDYEYFNFQYKEHSLHARWNISLHDVTGGVWIGSDLYEIVYDQQTKRIQLFGIWYTMVINENKDRIQLTRIFD